MLKTRLLTLLLVAVLLLSAGLSFAEGLEVVEDGAEESADAAILDLSDSLLVDEHPQEEALIPNASADEGIPERREDVYYPAFNMPDSDALFAGYVDRLFGKGVQPNGYAADQLKGLPRKIYDYLSAQVVDVAAGKKKDTYFFFPTSVVPRDSLEEGMEAISSVLDVLMADHPYEMFWCDKTAGIPYGYDGSGLYIGLTVAYEYASGTFEVDSARIKTAQTAARNAKNVVKKYAALSDYDKLAAYLKYICGATDYNDDALRYSYYGNPWQLIWVFDGDDSTHVVCEGYAKAFQYLCDMTDFQNNVLCISVTGGMNGGAHMWNVVRMEDGNSYLVDVTNSDEGTAGQNDDLFLKGYAAASGYTYVYALQDGWGTVQYTYDQQTLNLFPAKILKMSRKDYTPGAQPASVTIQQGKSAKLYMGRTLSLKASVAPSGTKVTWSSSNEAVATVSKKGVVKPKKKGTAMITAKGTNDKSATITVKVVDAKSVKLTAGKQATLKKGKKLSLQAKVSPDKVKTKLTWKSSDTKIATVTSKGVVKGKKPGTATITVSTANGKKASIKITVTK